MNLYVIVTLAFILIFGVAFIYPWKQSRYWEDEGDMGQACLWAMPAAGAFCGFIISLGALIYFLVK